MRDVTARFPEARLQVAMAQGSTFTLPWSFVYDIYLPSHVPPSRLPVCPVVSESGAARSIPLGTRRCPHADDDRHREGVLCPFGFWGFRHSIELLTSTDAPRTAIRFVPNTSIVVAKTSKGVKADRVAHHVGALSQAFAQAAPGLSVQETECRDDLRTLIEADLPILYFLCHGVRRRGVTLLGLGKRDDISPDDVIGWVDVAAGRGRRMWTDPQPFVFVNACASLAIAPEDLVDYLNAFVGKGRSGRPDGNRGAGRGDAGDEDAGRSSAGCSNRARRWTTPCTTSARRSSPMGTSSASRTPRIASPT